MVTRPVRRQSQVVTRVPKVSFDIKSGKTVEFYRRWAQSVTRFRTLLK